MRETWTGNLIGEMHNAGITFDEVAFEMGVSKGYVSMILNGHRTPPNAQERMEAAFHKAVKRKRGTLAEDKAGA